MQQPPLSKFLRSQLVSQCTTGKRVARYMFGSLAPRLLAPRLLAPRLLVPLLTVTFVSLTATAQTASQANPQTNPPADPQAITEASDCVPSGGLFDAPDSSRRTIAMNDGAIRFSIPENYQTVRYGSQIDVLSPNNYALMECLSDNNLEEVRPYGVTVAVIQGALTETDIRGELTQREGQFWGTTSTPNGRAFMHTTNCSEDLVHLSLPMPDQAITIVFTTDTDGTGWIIQENVFETILGTLQVEQ